MNKPEPWAIQWFFTEECPVCTGTPRMVQIDSPVERELNRRARKNAKDAWMGAHIQDALPGPIFSACSAFSAVDGFFQ